MSVSPRAAFEVLSVSVVGSGRSKAQKPKEKARRIRAGFCVQVSA